MAGVAYLVVMRHLLVKRRVEGIAHRHLQGGRKGVQPQLPHAGIILPFPAADAISIAHLSGGIAPLQVLARAGTLHDKQMDDRQQQGATQANLSLQYMDGRDPTCLGASEAGSPQPC